MQKSLAIYWQQFLDPSFKDNELFDKEIPVGEFVAINWILMMVKTLYVLVLTYLGAVAPKFFASLGASSTPTVMQMMNINIKRVSIFITLLEVVFFPIAFYFLYKLWVAMLSFFADVFEYEQEDIKKACRLVVKRSYSVNFLFLLPIIGGGLSILAQGLYLYLGMKGRLGFSNLQAILVLMVPLVILGCLAIFLLSYIFFIFSLMFAA